MHCCGTQGYNALSHICCSGIVSLRKKWCIILWKQALKIGIHTCAVVGNCSQVVIFTGDVVVIHILTHVATTNFYHRVAVHLAVTRPFITACHAVVLSPTITNTQICFNRKVSVWETSTSYCGSTPYSTYTQQCCNEELV